MNFFRLIDIPDLVAQLSLINRLIGPLILTSVLSDLLILISWLRLFLFQMVILPETSSRIFWKRVVLAKLLVERVSGIDLLLLLLQIILRGAKLEFIVGSNTLAVVNFHLIHLDDSYLLFSWSFVNSLSVLRCAVFDSEVMFLASDYCHLGVSGGIRMFLVISIVTRWETLFSS